MARKYCCHSSRSSSIDISIYQKWYTLCLMSYVTYLTFYIIYVYHIWCISCLRSPLPASTHSFPYPVFTYQIFFFSLTSHGAQFGVLSSYHLTGTPTPGMYKIRKISAAPKIQGFPTPPHPAITDWPHSYAVQKDIAWHTVWSRRTPFKPWHSLLCEWEAEELRGRVHNDDRQQGDAGDVGSGTERHEKVGLGLET